MKKIVKKYGDSKIIRFSPDEVKIFHIKEGSIVDLTITKVYAPGELSEENLD